MVGAAVRQWVPRPFQPLMYRFGLSLKRFALLVPMGFGKSSVVLWLIDTLLIAGEVSKVLILAPLRVARSTWPDEVRTWSNFAHLRIVAIVGTEKERRAALATPADIYTCNYDQIVWLIDTLGDAWDFDMVVADEATRLKGFRLRQGTKRAQALAKIIHTKVKRFVALSGTPAPNGIQDLWALAWFIDKGERLGLSFSAFENRWFGFQRGANPLFAKRVPFPHAQDEIQAKLQDVCLTLSVKDWFDIAEPIVNTIRVTLPPDARRHYREMERDLFTNLAGHEIEAFSAAAKTMKCIAEGAEILTLRGWVPIETVTRTDSVWDGVEWVETAGAVYNGYKTVVECWGSFMTSDHKVLTTDGWREAEEIARADASDRPYRPDVRLPDDCAPGRVVQPPNEASSYVVSAVCMRHRVNCNRFEFTQPEQGGEEVVRVSSERDASRCLGYARNDRAPSLGHVEQHAFEVREPQRQRLAKLRRTRHYCMQAMGVFVRKLLGRHGPYVDTRANTGSHQKLQELHTQELQVGDRQRTSKQPSGECTHKHSRWQNDSRASVAQVRDKRDHDPQTNRTGVVARTFTQSRVFDIVNAGPRHRFTIRGSPKAAAIVVHNCLQMANGAAYVGDSNTQWEVLHNEKIEALRSVIEEASGAPVMVAYHFRSDLARLQKAFPEARVLDNDPKTITQWNAGEISILLTHPASAGHGLSLQHGGNILVFFSLNWNLEEHLQVIERIGPVRQQQSGYDRPVFLHYIIATGTIDESVLDRLRNKRSVQDVLLEALKRVEETA